MCFFSSHASVLAFTIFESSNVWPKFVKSISKPDVNDARGSDSDSSTGTKSSVANSHDIECRDQIFVDRQSEGENSSGVAWVIDTSTAKTQEEYVGDNTVSGLEPRGQDMPLNEC